MPKTIPIIITNESVLVKEKDSNNFVPFISNDCQDIPNIPFYHQFAKKIAETQNDFKHFVKSLYGNKLSKYVLALIIPDDTSKLESIFINEFFLHSDAGKAVAQAKMSQIISKEKCYITISKTMRNVVLQYIRDGQIAAEKYYDATMYDAQHIYSDANRIHIDIEYLVTPIYINDFNKNMDEFYEFGEVVSTKQFLTKVSAIEIEKNK